MNLITKSIFSLLIFSILLMISNPSKAEINPFISNKTMEVESQELVVKCGEGKTKTKGKCGEGKCGEGKAKTKGKCGEGKCGEGKTKTKGKCGEVK